MSAPVQPGEILAGKYKVERVLGVGGMGVVVAATHLELDERVAIKMLLPDALASEEAVERFAREARAAVKIKSEHVARVSDVGKLDSGAPYMVMEYLEGRDLAALLEVEGMLSVEDAVSYVLEACEAIAEAHALGIVHRDLKPSNLFLATMADGTRAIKVLDFGISKDKTGRGSRPEMVLTKTTAIMGSPFYMSPEQMRSSKTVDARADIWALGVILHELIAGKAAFDAPTMPELCAKILTEEPEPLSRARPGVTAGVEAVVRRCLDKTADRRFQSIGEFATALAPFGPPRARASVDRIHRVLEKAGIPIGPATPLEDEKPRAQAASAPTVSAAASTIGTWNTQRIPSKSSSKPMIFGMVAALLVGVVATTFVLRGHGDAARSGAAPAGSGAPSTAVGAAPSGDPRATATSEPVVSPALSSSAATAVSAEPSAAPAVASVSRPSLTRPLPSPGLQKPPATGAPKPKPKADLFADPK